MLNRTILSLICILGLISCLTACNDKEAVKQKVQAIQVTTLKAEPTTLPYVAEVFGQTEGSKAVIVYPQVTGPVLQRHYLKDRASNKAMCSLRLIRHLSMPLIRAQKRRLFKRRWN